MGSIFCEISRYLMIIVFALYTWSSFAVFGVKSKDRQEHMLRRQARWIFLLHLDGYLVLLVRTQNKKLLLFYAAQAVFFLCIISGYKLLYEKSAQLLSNHMCMLMAIGFLMLSRLSYEKAVRQFTIAAGSMIFAMGIPYLIKKIRFIRRLGLLYAAAGLCALAAVSVLGAVSYGAKISFTIAKVSIQPTEFVKILFVFFVASMFCQSVSVKRIALTTGVAAAHVMILVFSKDLGGALIFFVVYLTMLYVATKNPFYFLGGLACGSAAAAVAYRLFSHVRVRVMAWQDPVSVIEKEGYQICQSLFAIGTGGWFGVGLYRGMPEKIPVVEQDFGFSAIAEEMGGIFAICLIMVCMSCFLMFLNIAMQLKDGFYKLVALGLGTTYGFQVFLTIGGVMKFIPSTGVTLPLVSYGGSSFFGTVILFAIIQGFYILRETKHGQGGRERE